MSANSNSALTVLYLSLPPHSPRAAQANGESTGQGSIYLVVGRVRKGKIETKRDIEMLRRCVFTANRFVGRRWWYNICARWASGGRAWCQLSKANSSSDEMAGDAASDFAGFANS
jgi:hypothetical protein